MYYHRYVILCFLFSMRSVISMRIMDEFFIFLINTFVIVTNLHEICRGTPVIFIDKDLILTKLCEKPINYGRVCHVTWEEGMLVTKTSKRDQRQKTLNSIFLKNLAFKKKVFSFQLFRHFSFCCFLFFDRRLPWLWLLFINCDHFALRFKLTSYTMETHRRRSDRPFLFYWTK